MALDLLYYRVRELIAADNAADRLGDARNYLKSICIIFSENKV
jgi:hypothetical protein